MNNLEKVARTIERVNDRKALGYESTIDFNYGYITALAAFRVITQKERNALMRVYASQENDDCTLSIRRGQLVQEKSTPIEDF